MEQPITPTTTTMPKPQPPVTKPRTVSLPPDVVAWLTATYGKLSTGIIALAKNAMLEHKDTKK